MARHFRVEDVAPTPRGWKVRTIISGGHRVRLAFPPGRREKGAGMVVQVLHPHQENPCPVRNPAELVLMGGNPFPGKKATRERATRIRAARLKNPYDALSRNEKLAFGRLGLGKRQLRTEGDIRKARAEVASVNRLRNHLPNGAAGAIESSESQQARELASEFKHAPSDTYQVYDEPHVPAGNYSHLGMFVYVAVKPHAGGDAQVKTISFPNGHNITVVDKFGVPYQHSASDVVVIGKKHPIFLIGEQRMDEAELKLFGAGAEDPCLLGQARAIAYIKEKWHPQAPDSIRGKKVVWEHPFGDEGGRKPEIFYSRRMQRLLVRGGDYTVEGVGIKN